MQQILQLNIEHCGEREHSRFVGMEKKKQPETCLCEDYHFLNVFKVHFCPSRLWHSSVVAFIGTVALHYAPAFVELGF